MRRPRLRDSLRRAIERAVDRLFPCDERCECCRARLSFEQTEYDVEGVPLCHRCMSVLVLGG